MAHDWIERFGLTACRKCGIVKRRDGTNKPCPGPVRVELRQNRIVRDEPPELPTQKGPHHGR